ncbi:MAG: hypothetical protein LBH51_08375, partial [Treponema sp.]|nr:hypothetical protein [Treponema sp.]
MPHFEKATHIRTDYPALTVPGGHYGVIYARKKAAARQIRSRCQKAGRNEKSTIPDEFISIAGC